MFAFSKKLSVSNLLYDSHRVSVGMKCLRCVLLLFCVLCPIVANADILYYQDYMHLDATRSAPGAIVSCTWSSSSDNVAFELKENRGTAIIYARRYFSGIVTISASYKYQYYSESEKKIKEASGHDSWIVSCGQVSVSLVPSEFTSPLTVGQQLRLSITMSSKDHTVPMRWESSNTTVATVDNQGNVTAKAAGTTTITLYNDWDGTSSSGTLTVKTNEAQSISILADNKVVDGSTLSMAVGDRKQLSYEMSPSDAVSTVSWDSDNTNIVTVSSSGMLRAISQGRTTITCRTSNAKWTLVNVRVYLPGDVDGDGEVCVADLSAIVNYFKNRGSVSNFNFDAADVNKDGFLSDTDVQLIENIILNK